MFFSRTNTAILRTVALAVALTALPLFGARGGGNRSGSARSQTKINSRPGQEILGKLSSMTPQQREQALSRLPPAQRAEIEQRIQNFQKLPPAAQQRTLQRLAQLNSLPAREQAQVRRSMQQFNALPQERKMAIDKDLEQIAKMPESERQAYMKSEDFRHRYSPDEQKMVGHLARILPPGQ